MGVSLHRGNLTSVTLSASSNTETSILASTVSASFTSGLNVKIKCDEGFVMRENYGPTPNGQATHFAVRFRLFRNGSPVDAQEVECCGQMEPDDVFGLNQSRTAVDVGRVPVFCDSPGPGSFTYDVRAQLSVFSVPRATSFEFIPQTNARLYIVERG